MASAPGTAGASAEAAAPRGTGAPDTAVTAAASREPKVPRASVAPGGSEVPISSMASTASKVAKASWAPVSVSVPGSGSVPGSVSESVSGTAASAGSGARTEAVPDGTARGSGWSAAPRPPEGKPDPDARDFFYLEGGPGTVLRDTLAVTNDSDRARTLRLRGADAYNASGGAVSVREPGRSTGPGTWIALAEDRVRVPARTRAEVPFTVTLPGGAVPGDHPAALVVDDGERQAGVRLHLRVSGPTLAALGVEHAEVRPGNKGEGVEVGYTLVNRGNTVLRPRLAVRADGLFGPVLRREARDLPVELLPGQRVTRQESWPDAPALDRADVHLTATARGGAHATASATYTAPSLTWLLTGLAALALAALVFGWYALRRRGSSRGRDAPNGPRSRGAPPGRGGPDGSAGSSGADGGRAAVGTAEAVQTAGVVGAAGMAGMAGTNEKAEKTVKAEGRAAGGAGAPPEEMSEKAPEEADAGGASGARSVVSGR